MIQARANPMKTTMISGIPSNRTRCQWVSPIMRLFLSLVATGKLVTQ